MTAPCVCARHLANGAMKRGRCLTWNAVTALPIVAFDESLNLKVNGKAISLNDDIEDGDELRVEESHLLITFYPIRSLPQLSALLLTKLTSLLS